MTGAIHIVIAMLQELSIDDHFDVCCGFSSCIGALQLVWLPLTPAVFTWKDGINCCCLLMEGCCSELLLLSDEVDVSLSSLPEIVGNDLSSRCCGLWMLVYPLFRR